MMNIMTSYFDILLDDVLLNIVSKLPAYVDTVDLRESEYTLFKLLGLDASYSKLLLLKYPEFYWFMINDKNVTVHNNRRMIYDFVTYAALNKLDIYSEDYYPDLHNKWYSFKVYKEFPKFYDEIKHINLSHGGIHKYPPTQWRHVYEGLVRYKALPFIQGNFSKKEYDIVVKPHLSDYVDTDHVDTFRLCTYIHIKHGGTFSLHTLYDFFKFNFDIYEELKHKDMIKSVTVDDVGAITKRLNQDLSFEMFIRDIKR